MTVNSRAKRRRSLAFAVLAATMLAACGGSDEHKSNFVPKRVVAFGDELSVIVDTNSNGNGSKYTVNATVSATNPTLVCFSNAIWSESLAASYGLVFPECNPNGVVAPASRIRAKFGARAADLGRQIDTQQAESPLGPGDLATVLVGENDVIAEYLRYPVLNRDQLIANVEAEGAEVGRQVNRITDTGTKVLLSTISDVGFTPFAAAERAAHSDIDRAALLSEMSQRFNATLRATIVNDGRKIGLILLDELVTTVVKNPGYLGFTNTSSGVCDLSKSELTPPSVLDCTNQTLVTGGGSQYFFADSRRMSASAHAVHGSNAINRAQNVAF